MAESSFPSPRRRVGIPALIAVVAFLLGIAAVDALSKGQDTATRVDPSEVASADVLLPPEWRWEREAIDFDHMFREK